MGWGSICTQNPGGCARYFNSLFKKVCNGLLAKYDDQLVIVFTFFTHFPNVCSFVFPFTGFIWRKCHTKGNFESTGAHREVDAKTDREKVKHVMLVLCNTMPRRMMPKLPDGS